MAHRRLFISGIPPSHTVAWSAYLWGGRHHERSLYTTSPHHGLVWSDPYPRRRRGSDHCQSNIAKWIRHLRGLPQRTAATTSIAPSRGATLGFDHRVGHVSRSAGRQSPRTPFASGTRERGPWCQHGWAGRARGKDSCRGEPGGMRRVTAPL